MGLFRRMAAGLLLGAMLLTAGCAPAAAEDDTTIQIPVYNRGDPDWSLTNNYYTRWIGRKYGLPNDVRVEYTAVGQDTDFADFLDRTANHAAPDLLFTYDLNQALSLWDEGALQPLDYEELARYAPTYYAGVQDLLERYGSADGQTVFLFARDDSLCSRRVTLIRRDWCEETGTDLPADNDGLIRAAEAWRDAGLGTLGGSMPMRDFTFMCPWLTGDNSEEEIALYLDKSIAPLTWEPTKRYLRDLNDKYNAGLLDESFFTCTTDADAIEAFVNGECGTCTLDLSSCTSVFRLLFAREPDAQVDVLPVLAGADCLPASCEAEPFGLVMGISAESTDAERRAVYGLLEWMSQPENLTWLQHGVQDRSYTVDRDGVIWQDSNYSGSYELSPNQNREYWCLVREDVLCGTGAGTDALLSALVPNGWLDLMQRHYGYEQDQAAFRVTAPLFTRAVPARADHWRELFELWQQAFIDCTTCPPDRFDEVYQSYCTQYLDSGYEEILQQKQSLLDAGAVYTAD